MATIGAESQDGVIDDVRRSRLIEWQLPNLEGARGSIVRSVYVALALAVLVVIVGSFWFNARDFFVNIPAAAEYGFRTRTADGRPEIATVSPRAAVSGLRADDRIVSIDGSPLAASATEFTIGDRLSGDGDGRITLVTRSTDGKIRSHKLIRAPVTGATVEAGTGLPLWLFTGIGFVSTQLPLLIWFGASLLLARRRPRDPEAMLFAFSFLLMCITNGSVFWLESLTGTSFDWIEIVANLGGALTLAAIAAFPDGRVPSRLSRFALAALLVVVVLVFAVPIAGVPSLFMDVVAIVAITSVLASVWQRYRRASDQRERQQIKWAVFGFCTALLIFLPVLVADNIGLVPDEGPWPYLLFLLVVPFAFLLIPLGLLVSLLRYRLYDAEAAISRSAGYAVLTVLLGATFAAVIKIVELLFENSFAGEAGAVPEVIGAGVAVALITPLNSRIQQWAERRFQRRLLQLQRDLPECVADMRETASLEDLAQEVVGRIAVGIRASRAALIVGKQTIAARGSSPDEVDSWRSVHGLDETIQAPNCARADRLFPIRLPLRVRHGSDAPVGWLLLGPRPDGSLQGKDEREVLVEIADPVARALRIVLVREEREAKQEARLEAMERKLAQALNAPIERQTGGSAATA